MGYQKAKEASRFYCATWSTRTCQPAIGLPPEMLLHIGRFIVGGTHVLKDDQIRASCVLSHFIERFPKLSLCHEIVTNEVDDISIQIPEIVVNPPSRRSSRLRNNERKSETDGKKESGTKEKKKKRESGMVRHDGSEAKKRRRAGGDGPGESNQSLESKEKSKHGTEELDEYIYFQFDLDDDMCELMDSDSEMEGELLEREEVVKAAEEVEEATSSSAPRPKRKRRKIS